MLVGILLAVLLPATTQQASATNVYLCSGYEGCARAGYSNSGYKAASSKMWWQMYAGHNCTNYAAYRVIQNGYSSKRPWTGSGNATNWGVAMKSITDSKPAVGAIAWWKANSPGVGSAGHVAYVEKVISATEIIISEDSWGGDFSWRRITTASTRWPSGFIHFTDRQLEVKTAPTVTGTAEVGQTLTLNKGTWVNAPTAYAYQWLADGVAIPKATTTSLVLTPELRGKAITATVSATRTGFGSAAATTAATAAVALGTITSGAPTVIDGDAELDYTLTLSSGGWAPTNAATSVQWLADGEVIPGATDWELTLTERQVDQRISAKVTAKAVGYRSTARKSAATEPVLAGSITATKATRAAGIAKVGKTLATLPGSYQPSTAAITYTWLRNGVEVATGPRYTLGGADVGAAMSLRTDVKQASYRPWQETVEVAGTVTALPTLTYNATGSTGRAVVNVNLRVPGFGQVSSGKVRVRIGARVADYKLVQGRVRIDVTDLAAGTRKVKVRYLGSGPFLPVTAKGTVKIR